MEPLAALVGLLRPRAVLPKIVRGAGRWGVRYAGVPSAGFGLVLAGECYVSADEAPPVHLVKGDFVLLQAAASFAIASDRDVDAVPMDAAPSAEAPTEVRHGDADGEPTVEVMGGSFSLDPTNIAFLGALLPPLVHVSGADLAGRRLAHTIELITDEVRAERAGRQLIVERLMEVLLVEALRFRSDHTRAISRPGLLEGLADPHVGRALRRLHGAPAQPWTVAELARDAGLSRSTFYDRFTGRVGMPPMEYLIQWRMAVAKDLLQRKALTIEQVAMAVGYQSGSAFSTAFRRYAGIPPSRFAEEGEIRTAVSPPPSGAVAA